MLNVQALVLMIYSSRVLGLVVAIKGYEAFSLAAKICVLFVKNRYY